MTHAQHSSNATQQAPAYIPQIRLYQDWLAEHRGLRFADYDALWHWSTTDLPAFWQTIWDYFDLQSPTPHSAVLIDRGMPNVQWFVGARVNYCAHIFRHVQAAHAAGLPAIISENEQGLVREMSWPTLREQVSNLALYFQAQGVGRGDRVAAYLPNIPEAMVCALASFSIGAVWSVCAPDMGVAAVLDRFAQIEPKVLIAVDGIYYGGKAQDRGETIRALQAALPTLAHTLILRTPYAAAVTTASASPTTRDSVASAHSLEHKRSAGSASGLETSLQVVLEAPPTLEATQFQPEMLPFDHPLWIVYSSGTTGLPKPIVHGHGGILLSIVTNKSLGNDIGCSYSANSLGERFHWYSSTGWVMWNAQLAGLISGTTICIYDGNPGGSKDKPDWGVLWRFCARHKVTFFGAGAAYFANCMKTNLDIRACGDLSRVRALGSTGSPLPEDVQRWGWAQFEAIGRSQIWWCNISGGTDFCGAFIGGNRELPQIPGQMQCRLLGCAVQSWDENGQSVVDAVGELVCTQPIPSMPLYFWNDQNNERYLSSYFDMYQGVWRHGDWLKVGKDGGCVIYGRSDATINRFGLRMGTSEIYNAVEALEEVLDSMVVDLEYLGRDSYMPLFVVLREGCTLDDALKTKINQAIATSLSPRFCPNAMFQVAEIPRTLSGKKQELPIKKLLLGQPLEKVVNKDAMANPACLNWYEQHGLSLRQGHAK